MWTKTQSIVTNEVTKEQMWKLFSDVNTWNTWDHALEYTKFEGKFEAGNTIILKPKDGPKVKLFIIETVENSKFVDYAQFPGAKMYDHHQFEETPQGLKITITISVIGILSFLWVKLVAQKIVDSLPNDMIEQINAAKKR